MLHAAVASACMHVHATFSSRSIAWLQAAQSAPWCAAFCCGNMVLNFPCACVSDALQDASMHSPYTLFNLPLAHY
jgi:hypothetical protein